jgi:urea transporter
MTMRFATLLCLAALGVTGCAGYRLGPVTGEGPGARSIQISPFLNQTVEPRLSEAVTTALRKSFQRDGTYRLATHDAGDILMTGVLADYQRREVSFQPADVLTVRDYRVTLTARVTAREHGTGKVLLDQPVSGYTVVRIGADLASAERQALPLLAADLAKNVTALLVEGSW